MRPCFYCSGVTEDRSYYPSSGIESIGTIGCPCGNYKFQLKKKGVSAHVKEFGERERERARPSGTSASTLGRF